MFDMNENQKKTTDQYRSNWDNIFKKKEEKDKEKNKDYILTLFQNIWGVGSKKAEILYEAGFRTIYDIKKNQDYL